MFRVNWKLPHRILMHNCSFQSTGSRNIVDCSRTTICCSLGYIGIKNCVANGCSGVVGNEVRDAWTQTTRRGGSPRRTTVSAVCYYGGCIGIVNNTNDSILQSSPKGNKAISSSGTSVSAFMSWTTPRQLGGR